MNYIAVLCTYKYCGALHLQILRCSAPTNVSARCINKYFGAVHLESGIHWKSQTASLFR
jgi:hypothetical protein